MDIGTFISLVQEAQMTPQFNAVLIVVLFAALAVGWLDGH